MWQVLKITYRKLASENILQYAAALAFYTLFSLVPILILVIALAGLFFGKEAAEGNVFNYLETFVGPSTARVVENFLAFAGKRGQGTWVTLLSFFAFVFGSTSVFNQLRRSLNEVWSVRRNPAFHGVLFFLKTRFLSLSMVVIIGLLVMASLVLNLIVVHFSGWVGGYIPEWLNLLKILNWIFSTVFVLIFFALAYEILPDVVLRWRDVWPGAAIAAVLFWAGRYLMNIYISRSAVTSFYGAAGSLVVVLLWVYYSAFIFFIGAVFSQAYTVYRGREIIPNRSAIKVVKEIVKNP